jgi:hypothetical protein
MKKGDKGDRDRKERQEGVKIHLHICIANPHVTETYVDDSGCSFHLPILLSCCRSPPTSILPLPCGARILRVDTWHITNSELVALIL